MDARDLRGFERLSVPFLTWLNGSLGIKRMVQIYPRYVTARWIRFIIRNHLELYGLEPLQGLRPRRGVLLVANHRSFFDMYATCAVLYRQTHLLDRIHFPVRSNFFYTQPLGLAINLAISGGAMWPPVFRDERRATLNPVGVEQTARILDVAGTVVGIHPEGTRGKGPDPYEFLPTRPGIGVLLRACHPETLVLPYFIAGLSNDFLHEVRRGLRAPRPGEAPIRIHFAAPRAAADFDRSREPQELADQLMGMVREQAERDRSLRASKDVMDVSGP